MTEILATAKFPDKARRLWEPSRFKAIFGGRGGAKSHSVSGALLLIAAASPKRVLCCREIQRSIRDSVKRLLDDKIEALGLSDFYDSTDTEIRGQNGSLFLFAGLRTNVDSIKSLEGIDLAWVAEAQSVSKSSLEVLIPTVREPGSEIWFDWNPGSPDDPVDQMFRGKKGPPPDSIVIEMNWRDNPWFPTTLAKDMEHDRARDPDKYAHVWEGEYRKMSEARVFKNWRVGEDEEFNPGPDTVFYLGGDWGFAQDPSALIRCYVEGRALYVDHEAYGVGVPVEDTPFLFAGWDRKLAALLDRSGLAIEDVSAEFERRRKIFEHRRREPQTSKRVEPDAEHEELYAYVAKNREYWALVEKNPVVWKSIQSKGGRTWPGVPAAWKWVITADSARPETIDHLRRHGFPKIQPSKKGAGSVEEGVEFLRSFDIIVHPRCEHLIYELSRYSYKIDPHTGNVIPVLEDRHNHLIDALRYALERRRKKERVYVY